MGSNHRLLDELRQLAAATRGLEVLLLYGSRATGQDHVGSDWDLGYLGEASLDVDDLRRRLVLLLQTDDADLVDLERASGLLRYQAARDGQLIHAASTAAYERFRLQAIDFWCELEPLLGKTYKDVLAGLGS